jgi:hypothetical protein
MRIARILLILLISTYGYAFAQSNSQKAKYMRDGLVEHHGQSATVLANDPRPLLQAARTVAEEYGWVVDFEDPLYSNKFDSVDDTDPTWRAANPNAKGTLSVAGGAFQSEFTEPNSISPTAAEMALRKIVEDYDASGNPGKFALSKENDGRFTIVGIEAKDDSGVSKPMLPLLDTRITIPVKARNGRETFDLFLQTLSHATQKVVLGSFLTNLLNNSEVMAGGENVTARSLLSSIISQLNTHYKLNWTLFFDLDSSSYHLAIWPAMRTQKNASGRSTRMPIEHDDLSKIPSTDSLKGSLLQEPGYLLIWTLRAFEFTSTAKAKLLRFGILPAIKQIRS